VLPDFRVTAAVKDGQNDNSIRFRAKVEIVRNRVAFHNAVPKRLHQRNLVLHAELGRLIEAIRLHGKIGSELGVCHKITRWMPTKQARRVSLFLGPGYVMTKTVNA